MTWSVYILKHPRTGEVRYVGWTIKEPEVRLTEHIRESIRVQKTRKQRWIFSLLGSGLLPSIEVIDTGVGRQADAERRWIAFYRNIGARLTNATDGGEGFVGWGTPEQRSTAAKARWAKTTPEERSLMAKKREAAKTPEQRSASAKKRESARTAEQHHAFGKSSWKGMTAEQRSEAARQRAAMRTPEQRRQEAIKREAAKTPEQRSRLARSVTTEQRREMIRKVHASRTRESYVIAAAKRRDRKS